MARFLPQAWLHRRRNDGRAKLAAQTRSNAEKLIWRGYPLTEKLVLVR